MSETATVETPEKVKRVPPTWKVVEGAFKGEREQAWTKGEARSLLRKRMGVPYLPKGVVMEMETQEGVANG